METYSHALPLVALCLPACLLCAPQTDNVTLENSSLRLTLCRQPVPYIRSLVHKTSGVSLVSDPTDLDLFAVALDKEGKGSDYVPSFRAGKSSVEVNEIEGGSKIVMTYSEFPNLDLWVKITATCRKDDPLTLWDIELKNNTGRRINYVRFPIVKAVPTIGKPEDDFIVLPYLPGSLIKSPWTSWPENQGSWLRFPGDQSAQFIAYQDRTAGIYLASMDAVGHPRSIEIWKRKDGFCLAQDFQLGAEAVKEWKSPYPMALGVTQGTWCDSADIYKQWAMKQAWCAKPLVQREDIPDWWKAGPLVHVCEVRTYDKDGVQSSSYYPKLLDHLRYLREKTDGSIVAMLAGWENHRRWTGGDYFPIFDQDNAVPIIAEMKKEGFRPFFYLSGLYYTFENEGRNGSKVPAADQHLSSFVVDEKTGKPQVFSLNESREQSDWIRHSYGICVGTPFAKTFFRDVIDRTHDLGVDILQMDQTVNGAGLPCWSTQHGHTPGTGPYQVRDFHDLLADMQTHGKGKSKDFVLFHEEPHEGLIPYLDGFHMREYKEKWWYRGLPGAVGIPLFSYLYHEYAIGYGGDSARIGPSNDRATVRDHAVNLVSGKTPGVAVWSYPQQLFESHPDPLKMIRNHCQLLKAGANRYLILGRMLHPCELNVAQTTYTFWAGKREKRKQYDLMEPAVLTSSWQSPEGHVGHLFVNPTESRQPFTVQMDTRNAPPFPSCDISVYSSEDGAFKPLFKAVLLPKEFSKELAPLEVLFVELRPAT